MHDFKRFPELTNRQMDIYYLASPHKQITENFRAKVVKVIDGDTIKVNWSERDFDFPIRFLGTNAPEMSEGGEESRNWLEAQLLNEEVDIAIDSNQRVGKWGRLLGVIYHRGMNINEDSIRTGHATSFDDRLEGTIPNFKLTLGKLHG